MLEPKNRPTNKLEKKNEKKTHSPIKANDKSNNAQEPTANELMLKAWQKIYENRHNRLL